MTVPEHVRVKVAYPCSIFYASSRFRVRGFRVRAVAVTDDYFPTGLTACSMKMGEFVFYACLVCSYMIGVRRFYCV